MQRRRHRVAGVVVITITDTSDHTRNLIAEWRETLPQRWVEHSPVGQMCKAGDALAAEVERLERRVIALRRALAEERGCSPKCPGDGLHSGDCLATRREVTR